MSEINKQEQPQISTEDIKSTYKNVPLIEREEEEDIYDAVRDYRKTHPELNPIKEETESELEKMAEEYAENNSNRLKKDDYFTQKYLEQGFIAGWKAREANK